jgi:hypothetical protein
VTFLFSGGLSVDMAKAYLENHGYVELILADYGSLDWSIPGNPHAWV